MAAQTARRLRREIDGLAALLCGFAVAFVLCSCGSAPIHPEKTVSGNAGSAQGQWRGKALLHSSQSGKTGTVNLDVVAQEPSKFHMEMTGPMGVSVASFVLNGDRVQYILSQKRKFVEEPADADFLKELVPLRISPTDLVQVLFDRTLPSSAWTCVYDAAGVVQSCAHKGEAIQLTWLERKDRFRKIKLETATAEATLAIDESKSKVELKPGVFELQAPEGYKKELR